MGRAKTEGLFGAFHPLKNKFIHFFFFLHSNVGVSWNYTGTSPLTKTGRTYTRMGKLPEPARVTCVRVGGGKASVEAIFIKLKFPFFFLFFNLFLSFSLASQSVQKDIFFFSVDWKEGRGKTKLNGRKK